MNDLRNKLIRLAYEKPEYREQLLPLVQKTAGLKKPKQAALSIQGEVPAKYQKLTEDFAKKFSLDIDGIRGTSKEVISNFVGNVLDAQKLAAWLKKYKVKGLHNNGRGFTVIWLK